MRSTETSPPDRETQVRVCDRGGAAVGQYGVGARSRGVFDPANAHVGWPSLDSSQHGLSARARNARGRRRGLGDTAAPEPAIVACRRHDKEKVPGTENPIH